MYNPKKGIMEDFPNTMKALEILIPHFFLGADVLYNIVKKDLHDNSKTAHRKGFYRSKKYNKNIYKIF